MVSWTRVKIASAPHSGLSVARHLGCPPPPHSSEKRSLVPSLLNVAECQYEKFESDTASIRLGLATSRMSSSSPTRTSDRKSTRLNSSHLVISYAVFCLKKKKKRYGMSGADSTPVCRRRRVGWISGEQRDPT